MNKEVLFSDTLSATTTAADVKAPMDSFLLANEFSWQNFKHICTDDDPVMIGVKSGFATLVKNKWSHVTSSHCSPYRCTLASKILPLHLMEVMDVAIKVISFFRLRTKNHRLFQLLTEEMGAQHVGLLF